MVLKMPMKRIAALQLLLLLICIGAAAAAVAQIFSDKIAAVVNGDVILYSEVEERKSPQVRSLGDVPLGVVPPGKWPTEREILDELIVIRLMEQEAARKGISVEDAAVDKSIEEMRQRQGLSHEKLLYELAKHGINYADFRKIRKQNFVLRAIYAKEVAQKITLSEEDVQNYFKKNKDRIDQQYEDLLNALRPTLPPEQEKKIEIPTHEDVYVGGRIRLRQITLKYPGRATAAQKEKVQEKARKILDEARTGADFGKLAKKYSQDQWARSGGDLGYMNYKDMAAVVQKIVQHMKKGSVHALPLPGGDGIIIFFLADATGRTTKRVRIPEQFRKQQQKRLEEFLEQQKKLREQRRKQASQGQDGPKGKANAPNGSGQDNRQIKDLGILTPAEMKEFKKQWRKVFTILNIQKRRERMKQFVEGLKENSIIDVRL